MQDYTQRHQQKSAQSVAFEYWLRTGRRLINNGFTQEQKFNPYHDPRDGRFTFAPGGGTLPPRRTNSRGVSPADQRGRRPSAARVGAERRDSISGNSSDVSERPSTDQARSIPVQYRPNPRAGMGGNGGPRLNDPLTLDRVFPGTGSAANSPSANAGSAIVAMADNILDITGPGARLTSSLAADHANMLIAQIRRIDPNFRFDSLGFPRTLAGQTNMIRQLRVDRALAFYRMRGELRPMQVEVLRHLQTQTDRAYDKAVALYNTGRLLPRLSREEALGNFVDREVQREQRDFYNSNGIETSRDGPIRIIGREYASSGSDRTYRIPDHRVGDVAFDVSLTRKTLATPQVRGFFAADFSPRAVIIVRPSQLGPGNTYRIDRPGK